MTLFFSLSGQRGTGRTKLYRLLKKQLPEQFPDVSIAFLGNPFPKLQFPLMWPRAERELDATTRLINCLGLLNEFCVKKLRPACAENEIVITDGFGLDVLLYATALCNRPTENDEAFRYHNGFVALRIREQGLAAPEYIITKADVPTIDDYVCRFRPGTIDLDRETRHRFIEYEERTIGEYFERIDHQKKPHFIDASLSIEQMGGTAISIIASRLDHDASTRRSAA